MSEKRLPWDGPNKDELKQIAESLADRRICPTCGHSSTMFRENDKDSELWFCNFCHIWWFIHLIGTYLPTTPPSGNVGLPPKSWFENRLKPTEQLEGSGEMDRVKNEK